MVTHDRPSEFDKADIKIQLLDRRKQSTDLNFCNKYKDCQRKQKENFIIRHFLFDIRYSAYCSRGFGPLFISPRRNRGHSEKIFYCRRNRQERYLRVHLCALRCARISLANLVSCNVDTLIIARSTGSKAGGARSNPGFRSPAERMREP
jgi:hypothetical protein